MQQTNSPHKTQISRREAIKAGGLIVLGLSYSKPFVDTVSAKGAFTNYNPDTPPDKHGDWDRSSIVIEGVTCDGSVRVVKVCNQGGGTMAGTLPWLVTKNGDEFASGQFGPLQAMGDCAKISITLNGPGEYWFKTQQHPDHPGKSSERGLKLNISSCGGGGDSDNDDDDDDKDKGKKDKDKKDK